eukprot:7702362-Pyramimonas_sp.AAC.1
MPASLKLLDGPLLVWKDPAARQNCIYDLPRSNTWPGTCCHWSVPMPRWTRGPALCRWVSQGRSGPWALTRGGG